MKTDWTGGNLDLGGLDSWRAWGGDRGDRGRLCEPGNHRSRGDPAFRHWIFGKSTAWLFAPLWRSAPSGGVRGDDHRVVAARRR